MRRLLIILIFFCTLVVSPVINAQKFKYGAFVGGNINFISLSSDYEIQDEVNLKPAVSYNIGGYIKTNNNHINLLCFIEYLKIRNKVNQYLADQLGNPLGKPDMSIINRVVAINLIGTIKIIKGFYLGGGLSGNILLKSSLKFDAKLNLPGAKTRNEYYIYGYKKVTFSIPVIIGYDFTRISIFTRLNIGMINRINDDSLVKEIDNPLILGIGYRINK